LLKVVEIRRVVAIADSIENAEMNLQRLLHLVEDAAHATGGGIAGRLFHVTIAEEIDIELGSDRLESVGEGEAVILRRSLYDFGAEVIGQELAQNGAVMD